MGQSYPVQMEISGPTAMFTRPDTGGSFVSYPAPTFSAAKGMFESIARLKSAYIRPRRVEICKPGGFTGTRLIIAARCGRAISCGRMRVISYSPSF